MTIINNKACASKTQSMLDELAQIKYAFHVTGVRFFAPKNVLPDTPWEFFVASQDGYALDYLTSLGFKQRTAEDISCSTTVGWRGPDISKAQSVITVHVIPDSEFKLRVLINERFYDFYNFDGKSSTFPIEKGNKDDLRFAEALLRGLV